MNHSPDASTGNSSYRNFLRSFFLGTFLLGGMGVFFFWTDIISAIDTRLEGYRVNSNTTKKIDTTIAGGECRYVTAPNNGNNYFVPTRAIEEWRSFKSAGTGLGFSFDSPVFSALRGGGISPDSITSTTIDPSGNTLVTGYFMGTSTDIFGTSLTSSGTRDIFIAKLDSLGNPLWVKKAGGVSNDYSYSVTTDPSGNILVTGYFTGPGINIFGTSLTSAGLSDIFLAKLDPSGNPLWVKKAGGISNDYGYSVTTDPSGNILVTGYFMGTSTDIFGTSLTSSGLTDIFLAKLDPSGNPLWVKKAGGVDGDVGVSNRQDSFGNVYVTGYFSGSSADIFGTSLTSSGLSDIFIAKLDSLGNPLWVKKAGGISNDINYFGTTDPSGNILVTGYFEGTGTDIFGTSLTSSGLTDIFLAKLDPSGNPLWVKKAGGITNDYGFSITTDPSGNILVTGYFTGTGTDIFGTSLTSSGGSDIFLAKLDPNGNFFWVKKAGGITNDVGYSTITDPSGNILVTGYFEGTGTDIFGTSLTSSGGSDIFLAKLDPNGDPYRLSHPLVKQAGGSGSDSVSSATADSSGNILVTGYFEGIGSMDIFGTSLTSSGGSDIFLAKLDPSGNPLWMRKGGGSSFDGAGDISLDLSGNSVITGYFLGSSADIFGTSLTSSGSYDIFLAKLDPSGNPLWVKKAGGVNLDVGVSNRQDTLGNVYVTGYFSGSNADIFGTSLTSSGGYDIFLAKLDPSGNPLWVKKSGGILLDKSSAIALDSSNNILVTGYFQGTGTTDIFGASLTSSGLADIFLAKLDPSGNPLWVKKTGGSSDEEIYDIGVDSTDSIVVTGYFKGTSTDIFGTSLTSSGVEEIFLAKLDSSGNPLWVKKAGGTGYDYGNSIDIDSDDNVLVTGSFRLAVDLFGTSITGTGNGNIFIAKLSANGNPLWVKDGISFPAAFSVAPPRRDFPNAYGRIWSALTIDISDNAVLVGVISSTASIFGNVFFSRGGYDMFLTKLDPFGNLIYICD